jgi:hypothetical protein
MTQHQLSILAACPAVILLLCGCGPTGPPRTIVSGTVNYQGQPVAQGAIRFVPSGDTQGPSCAAVIENGKYEARSNGGVIVGTNRVEITAVRPRKDPAGRDIVAMEGAGVQYIPEKYNRASTLTVTIEAGAPLVKDFDLK